MKFNGIDFNEKWVKSLSLAEFLESPTVSVHGLTKEQATTIYQEITGSEVATFVGMSSGTMGGGPDVQNLPKKKTGKTVPVIDGVATLPKEVLDGNDLVEIINV